MTSETIALRAYLAFYLDWGYRWNDYSDTAGNRLANYHNLIIKGVNNSTSQLIEKKRAVFIEESRVKGKNIPSCPELRFPFLVLLCSLAHSPNQKEQTGLSAEQFDWLLTFVKDHQ